MTKTSMLNGLLAAGCLCVAPAIAAGGQQGSAAAGQAAVAGEHVTIVGCLERADQLTPPGSDLQGSVDSQSYALMKADEAGATASEPPSADGRRDMVGPLYWLVGEDRELSPKVGHKVEISGMREGSDKQNAEAQAANAQNPSAAKAPRLIVESVKSMSETCPR
jgi:hypothetical protein